MSPLDASEGAVAHIAVVGMGRSGSTFLEGLLAHHLQGVAVGELPGAWSAWQRPDKLCSCGQRARNCDFWADVGSRYAGLDQSETVRFMQEMNRRTLSLRRATTWPAVSIASGRTGNGAAARYGAEISRLYIALESSARSAGYRTVVDSSKHPFWYHLAHRRGALECFHPRKAVRLVRHPRAVAFSLRRPRNEETASGPATIQNAYRLWQAIPYWLVMNLVGDAVTGDDALVIRYEELADTGYLATLESAGFRCVRPDEVQLQPQWSHQLVGNPTRQNPAASQFENDLRWSEQRIGVVEDLSWRALRPVLRRYGYSAQPPRS